MSREPLTFSVDSLLLGELGERLVTKNYIALAELIKNSYDADATEVKVRFINTKGKAHEDPDSEIHIEDIGHGMTFNQIKEFWMRIATPNKLREPISPHYMRKKTGSKGIGRFACRRLAKKLILESVAKNDETDKFEYTWVLFDWAKYVAGETLTEIPNEYDTKITRRRRKTGLSLRLIGLHDAWTETEFNVLRRQVLGLSIISGIQRKGYPYDPGMTISFDAPEFEKGRGELSKQVMDAGWGRLKGSVDDEGKATLSLNAMKIGKVSFELPELYSKISGASFDIAIIWRVKEYCRDPTTLTLGLIDEIFEEWGGVRVYLEGFRVYPYGEPGNDWLEIDEITARRLTKIDSIFKNIADNLIGLKERRPLLSHPRNRNLLGRVPLSNVPDEKFIVTMNREGFIENSAFTKLKEFIKLGLMWSTLHYSNFLYLEDLSSIKEAYEEFIEVIPEELEKKDRISEYRTVPVVNMAINMIEATTKELSKNLPGDLKNTYTKNTDKASRLIKESVYHMEKQINYLRTVASTGALMIVFEHETKELGSRLETYAGQLERVSENLNKKNQNELISIAKNLRSFRDKFHNQLKILSGITKGISDIKRRKVKFNKIFLEVKDCYSMLTDDFDINIQPDFDKNLFIGPIYEAELYSIVINLISNAIKAVIANSSNNIKVSAFKTKQGNTLRIYDDGIGLSKESRELVLQPFIADPEGRLYKALEDKIKYKDLLDIGEGSGLGLSIVKDIVNSYGENIQFIDAEKPWKTCVEVTLP